MRRSERAGQAGQSDRLGTRAARSPLLPHIRLAPLASLARATSNDYASLTTLE